MSVIKRRPPVLNEPSGEFNGKIGFLAGGLGAVIGFILLAVFPHHQDTPAVSTPVPFVVPATETPIPTDWYQADH